MNENAHQDIQSIKEFLLENNPARINPDNQDEITDEFINCFQKLFVFFNEKSESLSDSSRLLVTDTFSIWVLRTTQVISQKKIDISGYFYNAKDEFSDDKCTKIFQYVLDFWIDGNSAFINALKDLFNKFLHLIRKLRPPDQCTKLFTSWLDRALQVPSSLPVQYYLIDALARELDLYHILEKKPDFIDTSLSLMWSDALSNPVGRCLSRFLINIFDTHLKKNPAAISGWLALWQESVMIHLGEPRSRKAIELYVLAPVFKQMPKSAFSEFVQNIKTTNYPLLLSIFKLGQELGIEEEPFHENRLISLDIIANFLKQDNLKLSAFELLTLSTKKSQPVRPYVFTLVEENLTPFFVDTQIETRNYFCSSFKHFLHRIRDSAHASNKSAMSLKRANKFPKEQREKFTYLEECKTFIQYLLQFLKSQICPGTQYQRNDTAFKLLKIIVESGVDASIPKRYIDTKNAREYPFSIQVFDESMVRLLFDCLASSYPDIRLMAKKSLLMAIGSSYGDAVMERTDWKAIEERSLIFLKEYQYSDIGAVLQDVLYRTSQDKSLFISDRLEILLQKVHESNGNHSKNIDQSINGYLTSLNLILHENEYDLTSVDSIVKKCIAIVFDNWQAVKHVICHDSDETDLHLMYPDGNTDIHLILSTAFRTTKESSALLHTLIQVYPLSGEQLIEIGEFLIDQLFSIRHSGAFQSVSPTFLACCLRCRKENPSLLKKWLDDVLKSLEIKTQNVTRRSGGIPSLLTVILATETNNERPLLKHAFEVLTRIASTKIDEHQDKVDLPQVNAFNCIKAIFTESKLSDVCDEYAAQALDLALGNFDSHIWALRNCSIMLFTSLQNRLFGKKGKSVSARLFFTRYQGVRENLLDILRSSMSNTSRDEEKSEQASQVESIFLVLSVLLRLKPTPGYNGLKDFTTEISRCLKSSNWKVRKLSALVLSSMAEDPLSFSESILKDSSPMNQNSLHGYLLVVKEAINSRLDDKSAELSDELVNTLFCKSDELLCENSCFVTANAYLSLMASLLKQNGSSVDKADKKPFLKCLGSFFVQQDSLYAVDGTRQLCLTTAIKILLEFGNPEDVPDICELGILSPFYEVQKAALQWLTENVHLSSGNFKGLCDSIEKLVNRKNTLSSVSSLSLLALDALSAEVNIELLLNLIERPSSEDIQLTAIECIGKCLPASESGTLESIVSRFGREDLPLAYRVACFKCLTRYPNIGNEAKLLFHIHQMLSDDDEELREMAAAFLNNILSLSDNLDGENMSPSVIAERFGSRVSEICSIHDVQDISMNQIKQFFVTEGNDPLCYDIKSNTKSLFELEKDNLYKNELEQNMQYVKILQATEYDDKQFKLWLDLKRNEVTHFLSINRIIDGPFGWASYGAIFSRLYVLNALISSFTPEKLDDFRNALTKSSIHPVILNHK